VIEKNKDLYYKALRRTQTTLKGAAPDWEPWVGFFLRCLKKQKNNLAERLDRDQITSDDDTELPEISLKILTLLRTHNRQNIVQITEATGANRNTVKLRLRELVNSAKIRRHGKARATWYTL
jgi:Fic family protein